MPDEMTLQNTSKFATFLEYENPSSLDQGINWGWGELSNMTWKKKTTWIFKFQKYGNF